MKNDPTQRALRAVANITLTLGLGGCIQDIPNVEPVAAPDVAFMFQVDEGLRPVEAEDEIQDEIQVIIPDDADAAVAFSPDAADPDAGSADAAWVDPDTSVADSSADATVVCLNPGSPEWGACCEAVDWDWREVPSCSAWGPPVPPAMEVA